MFQKQEGGPSGWNRVHKGEMSHKLVRRADHVGAFRDLGGTWALSPKGSGSHGRMLSIEEVQSSHILTGSLWLPC